MADVAENKAEKVESAEPAKEPVRTAAKEASSNDKESVKDEVDQQNLFDNLGDLDAG